MRCFTANREPSIGCTTEPMILPLSGSFMAIIAVKKYINPDGTDPSTTPDIEVKRDYEA